MRKGTSKGAMVLGVAVALLGLLGCAGNSRDESEANIFLIMEIQDTKPLAVLANIREDCHDVAQLRLEVRPVGGGAIVGPYKDGLLKQICVSYYNKRTQDAIQGVTVPYTFCTEHNQLISLGGELLIGNYPVLWAAQKMIPPLDRSTGMVFPMELTVFLTAYAESVDGEKLSPETLEMTLYIADEPPRAVPCPSME